MAESLGQKIAPWLKRRTPAEKVMLAVLSLRLLGLCWVLGSARLVALAILRMKRLGAGLLRLQPVGPRPAAQNASRVIAGGSKVGRRQEKAQNFLPPLVPKTKI